MGKVLLLWVSLGLFSNLTTKYKLLFNDYQSDHEGDNEDGRVDPIELDGVFDIIRQIELRAFIYDSTDDNHSKRDLLNKAWMEISTDIRINGKKVTGKIFNYNKVFII